MVYRKLGRTGEEVSIVGVGGAHLGNLSDDEAARLIHSAIDRGVTFMDNCWDYHDGECERRMGKALAAGAYRRKVFLMTKLDGHDAPTAARQIDESLARLKTDHVDLMQFHEVIRPTDPDRIFAPGGALEAMLAARKAGKVRFIGFTGHKDPEIHLHMLATARAHGFRFDAVQMPLNVMDAHFKSFEHKVLPALVREGIGVLGMKSMGAGDILASKAVTAIECLHYAMNLPTSTVITGMDSMEVLEQALAAVKTFKPLSKRELAQLLARTAAPAATGRFERFKTANVFDGTVRHPEWLGPSA